MRPRRRFGAVLLILALLLTGCWDRTELEDQFYVLTLGIDRGDQPGEYMVTALVGLVQLFSTGVLESPAKPEQPFLGVTILTARAQSMTQAIHIMNAGATRRLDLRHLRAIVVGEELAREGLVPVVTELTRNIHTRGSNLLLQAMGSAYDLLKQLNPIGEMNASRMAEGYIIQAKHLHLAPPTRLHHFVQRLSSQGGDPYLPAAAVNENLNGGGGRAGPMPAVSSLPGEVPRGGGNPVEVVGTAIYRRDRLVGFLTINETQMFLALRGEMGKAYLTVPDPLSKTHGVAIRFHMENIPSYRSELRGGRPYVRGQIVFEGEVLAIPSGVDYARPDLRPRLEAAASAYAESTIRGLLAKLHGWGADPVGFGQRYRKRFASWDEWAAWNWRGHIPDLQVEVGAEMRIRRYGLITGRPFADVK